MRMTPLHLQMLLHYHSVAEPYGAHNPKHANSQAVFQFKCQLVNWGLIEPTSDMIGYRTTEKGEAYVRALLSVPLPVAQWVIPGQPTTDVHVGYDPIADGK